MSATARNRYRPGLAGLIRREWYMTRLDWGLRTLPSREIRRILRDLRRDVTATASDTGMRSALADLGKPSVLAEGYTSGVDAAGPRYTTGAIAAVVTAGAIAWLLMAYAIGTLDTLVAVGGGTRTANLWGADILFTGTADVLSVETADILSPLLVIIVICAVVYVLFSRIWRLGRSR